MSPADLLYLTFENNSLPWFNMLLPPQEERNSLYDLLNPVARQLGLYFKPTASGNAQQQQMDQVRPTYESNSLADLYKQPDYTQQAWNPYGYDYAPPDYNADDAYGFGQTSMNQNTYGMG